MILIKLFGMFVLYLPFIAIAKNGVQLLWYHYSSYANAIVV